MFHVIINEFRHRSEPHPVVLFVINKVSKVSFYHAILLLSLAVGPKMESGRELSFDAQELVQGRPELKHEYWAAVADNGVGQTVVSNYNIEEDFY